MTLQDVVSIVSNGGVNPMSLPPFAFIELIQYDRLGLNAVCAYRDMIQCAHYIHTVFP